MDVRLAWYVPDNGHDWRTRDGVQRLVWKREAKGGYVRKYIPDASLFREFAALKANGSKGEDAIKRFAAKYGDILAVPGDSHYFQSDPNDKKTRRIERPNATLKIWRFQVTQMRFAVGLWDQSQDKNASKASRLNNLEALQIEVESALRDTTTPSCTRVCLNARLELFVHPVNLLAFMWLTLARLVSGEIEERRCIVCRERCIYVGSGPGLHRADRLICGPRCRKAVSRAKLKAGGDAQTRVSQPSHTRMSVR